MDKITITLVVLGAAVGGMFNVMKIVELKNGIRNLVLNIDDKGRGLSPEQKQLLLTHDYFPIAIGLFLFLLVFSGGLLTLPAVYEAKAGAILNVWERVGCYGTGCVAVFAMFVDALASVSELVKMDKSLGGNGWSWLRVWKWLG